LQNLENYSNFLLIVVLLKKKEQNKKKKPPKKTNPHLLENQKLCIWGTLIKPVQKSVR